MNFVLTISKSKNNCLEVTWTENEKSKFHYIWLRDHCQCSKCVESVSTERIITRDLLDLQVRPTSVNETDGNIHILWNDGHKSVFSSDFLNTNSYSKKLFEQTAFPPLTKVPKVNYSSIHDEEGLFEFLEHLNVSGICLLTDCSTEEGMVEKVSNTIGHVRETTYGKLFKVVSRPDADNIAYTSLELKPHVDLCYLEATPGFQLLHCMKQSMDGGESTFVDAYNLAMKLKQEDPESFDVLSKVKVTFSKNDSHRQYYFRRPTFVLNEYDELISIYYSPPFEGPLKADEDLIEPFYKAYQKYAKVRFFKDIDLLKMVNEKKNQVEFKLNQGEIVVFNNRRVLHGRNEFSSTQERILEGCYFDTDEFWCIIGRSFIFKHILSMRRGNKIYCRRYGTSCHQCRQKTIGRKTECSNCRSSKGQFCNKCLKNRYGANIIDVFMNKSWICASCRGFCNCSLCFEEPTGTLIYVAKKHGYQSVHHLLLENELSEIRLGIIKPSYSDERNIEEDTDFDIMKSILN
eukprot:gene2374-2839_t